ncbi:MAG: carboxymuconolactone decarboxylase family protein [Acidobacteria bacterium]|nr:carboxymuconolactone decarboxylase family protein [Acidobacteriota bacterium]
MGRRANLTQDQILDVLQYETSGAYSPAERAVLRMAEKMTLTPAATENVFHQELRAHFTDRQIVELAATIAWENYRARFNHALGIESAGFAG